MWTAAAKLLFALLSAMPALLKAIEAEQARARESAAARHLAAKDAAVDAAVQRPSRPELLSMENHQP